MATAYCANSSAIAAPTGSAAASLEPTSTRGDNSDGVFTQTTARRSRVLVDASDDAGFAEPNDARSLVEELRVLDDPALDKPETRVLQASNAFAAVSGSFSADLSSDLPVTSVAPPVEVSPSSAPISASNATVVPHDDSSAPPATPEPIATVPAPAMPNSTVPAPMPTIPTPPPTPAPEPTLTPEPTSEPTDGPATPTPSSESPTPEPSEKETTPAPLSRTPTQDETPQPTRAPRSTPTPKPNIILDIHIEDETNRPKKYTRNSDKESPAAATTTTAGSKQSDDNQQEERVAGSDNSDDETSTTTTTQEKIIGGKTRDNPVNAVTMSKDLTEFHDVIRYMTCTFAGISVALLLFFHYVSLDPDVDWSSALLWSPNTWEFVLYIGYLQQMGSLSQLNLAFTPYFLWDFTDSFSWSLFLVHESGASAATRRLDTVVLTGVVAFGDRIGVEETSLLFICSLSFLLVFGVLFAVYVALVLFAKHKAEDKFDVIVDNYSIIDPSQVRDGVFGLRLVSLRFLGLCVLIWLFALYPLSLFASFEISMQIDSDTISFGSLALAIVVLGLVCLTVLGQSARMLYDKSERELADVKILALWGSLYAAYTYRRRLFFLIVAFVQIGSGVLIGAMTTSASPTVLLVAVLVLQVAYLGAVFFQAGFISLSVGLFTFTLSVVKIVNYALAFAFLEGANQSSAVRTRVANAFIFINSIVLIAWFVRHAIMFALTLRALSQRKSESHGHSSANTSNTSNNNSRHQQQYNNHSEDEDEDELPPEMVEFQTPMERGAAGNGGAAGSAANAAGAVGNSSAGNASEPKVSNLSDSQLSSRGSNVYVTTVVSPARQREPSSHTTGSSASPPPTRGTIKMAL